MARPARLRCFSKAVLQGSVAVLLLLLAPLVSASDEPGYATIKGKVTFVGQLPTLEALVGKDDPRRDKEVCDFDVVPDERLEIDAKTKGIKNAVVWLYEFDSRQAHPDLRKVPSRPARWVLEDCRLKPHVICLRTEQRLQVVNKDPTAHNFHDYPLKNHAMGIAIGPAFQLPEKQERRYEDPERVPISAKCDYHPWVHGLLLIQDHPYMSVTAADGTFELPQVPSGTHKLCIWHEAKGYLVRRREIKVTGGVFKLPPTEVRLSNEDREWLSLPE